MTQLQQLNNKSNWVRLSVNEANEHYADIITPEDMNCVAVWVYTIETDICLWIQELDNGDYFTAAGRTSHLGTFSGCVECISDNI